MDTKDISITDRHGNVQNLKLEPLHVVAPRLWYDFALHKVKSGSGNRVWKNKATFLSHLRTAFAANRIELSCRNNEINGKCSLYVYEVCVIEYLDAYMDMAKVCKTKRGVFIKNVGLIHEPLFPKFHKDKGSEVVVVTKHVPTTKEIKVTEFIPRPESKLVKAIGRLRGRISNAIKGARNSIASRIAAN